MEWSEGDLVWFDSGLGHPLPGEIQEVHRAAQVIIVQALINGKSQTFTLGAGEGNLHPRQDLGLTGVEDMTQLEDLHEASLLWNLRLRYDRGLIYTFAGSILIAVNPYKMFADSYGLDVAKQYAGKPLGVLPPHLFAIGAAAHAALPSPQVVVISGESGSGKTESTKLVMQYLAAVLPGGGSTSTVITEQILEAAPLLEAFGNARTARNDNSSRFGKYLEVYFKSGTIVGAKITQYLLEKSRIVTQAPGERNYHVFYELLSGLSDADRTKYGLLSADKYFYLNQGGSDYASGRIDWDALQGAMQVLGVSEKEREGIIRVLASILHLGNVYFHRRQLRHGQEGVEIGSDAEIKWTAHLLQISPEGIYRSLTTRTTETRSERLHTPLGIDQALDARDAFAKILYSGLFNWLVSRVNSIVHKGGTHDAHRISILDIFGFEDLAENSFEQLCINYANENLQLYFNKHVFKLEQAEYARERLEWIPLTWEDNLPVIHLLAKKPVGIFHLLDDESNFPRASDLSFLEKCHYNHALNEIYSRPRVGAQEFGINHYAGQVWYCVEGFLEKNRDALRPDVLDLFNSSKLPLLADMTRQMRAQRDYGKTMPKGANGRFVTMKPRTPTVAARFSDSLQHLLQSMAKCNPWFVRCIKPNNDKQALKMDMPCVLTQLRYLGMLDTIRIRQNGYPVRLRFQHFVERYRYVLSSPLPRGTPYRELCRNVLESLPQTGLEGPDFQLGASRVFLREALHRVLESGRSERLRKAALIIQKNARGMLERKKIHSKKQAAVLIQSYWRRHRDEENYKRLKHATLKAQALFRGKRQRDRYRKLKNEMKRRKDVEKAQRERKMQRMSKESVERGPIMHLDVPAELAFIYSKLDGWTPTHGDRHLVKVVGTVPGPPMSANLPNDLEQFSFGKFSSVYCNGVKFSPRKDPITSPFLSKAAARDQDYQDALAVFKLILRWSNDASMENTREKVLADYIVHKGLTSKGLRDEILVQLCNQLYKTDESQSMRIWQLMSHCLSSFQPSISLHKYFLKFVSDNAPITIREMLLKKILRGTVGTQMSPSRLFPPSWLEWRAMTRSSDIAIGVTLPDEVVQTVAIDSWTTCEEAASLAVSSFGVPNQGWTVVLEDSGVMTDTCGLDYVLDLIAEKELCPAFPTIKSDLFKCGRKSSKIQMVTEVEDRSSLKRPIVPPPEPPTVKTKTVIEPPIPEPVFEKKVERSDRRSSEYTKKFENVARKTSHDLLSRSSALNDRYFEVDKSRSKSLDDLLNNDVNEIIPEQESEPLMSLGLSESRLNDRYHSTEMITPIKEPTPRYQKSQFAGRKTAGSHSSKYMDKSEYTTRSSAMSDTSEAPSLASHVRRVRVPSQASDVDQFLDDLFSPVLDGSLDELSDARSLAASIRGTKQDFMDAPILDESLSSLGNGPVLQSKLKGGGNNSGDENGKSNTTLDNEVASITSGLELSLDEYISDLFQPIFINDSIKRLTDKGELVDSIKGGGTTHQANTSGASYSSREMVSSPKTPISPSTKMLNPRSPDSFASMMSLPTGSDPASYQQNMQRAFLQSAMVQNLQIQQQLLAQNQALQTLLSQQEQTGQSPSVSAIKQAIASSSKTSSNFKGRVSSSPFRESIQNRKFSSGSEGSNIPPPPPPPMPPPIEFKDPSEARPFIDPYGRAKTVRIGKWRWPPPQDSPQNDTEGDFMQFKLRQNQRKTTPQSQSSSQNSNEELHGDGPGTIEWEEFEIEQTVTSKHTAMKKISRQDSYNNTNGQTHHQIHHSSNSQSHNHNHNQSNNNKMPRRSFEVGADRPPPGSVGKLKLSSEMRQRLEQVTAGHSVRSTTSNTSEQRQPAKLEDARKMMLQQQLSGHLLRRSESPELPSVRSQVKKMEGNKKPPPPPWPGIPPAPSIPAPPPPVRPPSESPPPPPPFHQNNVRDSGHMAQPLEVPAFLQRQDRDTFGARQNWNGSEISKDTSYDSWGKAESSKLDMVYDHKKELKQDRERSRSRSRSRDREHFSESVWDRSEVEGPPSSGSDREREKERERRDRLFELKQIEREKESLKVYQPPAVKSSHQQTKMSKRSIESVPERATFKTHMAQRMEKERKTSMTTTLSQAHSIDRFDEVDQLNDWPTPSIPAPVPAPPSFKSPATACLTYNRIPWKLRIRKEVFRPAEPLGPPAALNLLFAQVVSDVLSVSPCLRISPQEKRTALNLLASNNFTPENMSSPVRPIVKRHLVDMARNWPLYFARLFVVNGSPQMPDISILAVSHLGVFLARRESEYINVLKSVPFSELQAAVTLPRPAALQLNLKNGNKLVLHAVRANAIQMMIQSFAQEYRQVQSKTSSLSSGARAAAQTLNVPIEKLEAQVQQHQQQQPPPQQPIASGAATNAVSRPSDKQQHGKQSIMHHQQQLQQQQQSQQQSQRHHQMHHNSSMMHGHDNDSNDDMDIEIEHHKQPKSIMVNHHHQSGSHHMKNSMEMDHHVHMMGDDLSPNSDAQGNTTTSSKAMKYSLLQFAMQHFRNDDQTMDEQSPHSHQSQHRNSRSERRSFSGKFHTDLVKWQGTPIKTPLLKLPPDLYALALECFECIQRYCGDIPPDPEFTEVKCVYTVLMHCHKYLALRDEVYCQLMKQTTANRSHCQESSQRAWRLLSILAAYFGCSDALRPYLMEHLTAAASDRRRSSHGTAAVCLTNLRKTARCGGRKNVPSVEEVTAVSAGRSARRQIYRLPGGAERVVNTRCSTVVADVITELCALLGIESYGEQQEFSLYCIVQGDAFTMPLAADEYILDVTTELLKSGQPFYLIFCRSVWHFPLKRDPVPLPLYIEVLFNQVAPDYLEGLLLELPNGEAPNPDVVRDMARIAALLHRAADLNHVPAMKEIKFLLPKPALGIRELRPAQWVALVQSAWSTIGTLNPGDVKAQFLNVLATWPLFGSSFFAVKRVWADDGTEETNSQMWRELILALNRRGVLFLDPNSHETLQHWPFMEVISTRKVRSEDGALFLDMKVGNLMQQRVIRVQTEQAHEISRLIRQYITMAQMSQNGRKE